MGLPTGVAFASNRAISCSEPPCDPVLVLADLAVDDSAIFERERPCEALLHLRGARVSTKGRNSALLWLLLMNSSLLMMKMGRGHFGEPQETHIGRRGRGPRGRWEAGLTGRVPRLGVTAEP